ISFRHALSRVKTHTIKILTQDFIIHIASQNNDLPSQNNEIASQNNDLPSQNNDLPSQNNEIASQNNDLPSQNNEIASQNNDLPSQNNDLPSQNNDLPSQNNDLPSQNNEIQGLYVVRAVGCCFFPTWSILFFFYTLLRRYTQPVHAFDNHTL
uniref:Uncharacterized protein n=1 Tax=Astyanax mexicanus TaxID=7994 RepID=A0A3B1JBN6_ASTMX